MILSKLQIFSDAQAVTADAASTNVIDLGATGTVRNAPAALVRDVGKGNPIPVVVQLLADATGTSPTLTVSIQVDTVENFASPTTVATATAIAGGSEGDRVTLYYLPEGTNQRYLRVYYDVGGTSPVYSVDAFVPLADQTNDSVPGA